MSEEGAGKGLIQELLKRGVSKYRIGKELGVSWQTVNLWSKGTFQPRQTYAVKLRELIQFHDRS